MHRIATEQELAADDEATAEVLTVLVARGDTISRLSRHLATVIADTAFTAVMCSSRRTSTKRSARCSPTSSTATTPKPTINCSPAGIATPGPDPCAGPWEWRGNPAHSLTGILDAAVTELHDTHIHVE
ncbi:hypothetical protein FXW78_54085 [Rhodococcus opacus]|nr:hypothetical protein [Rhodococcus opacus]